MGVDQTKGASPSRPVVVKNLFTIESGNDSEQCYQPYYADCGAKDRKPAVAGEDRSTAGCDEAASVLSPRLDSYAINGTDTLPQDDALCIMSCKCRSWCCPACGPGYWWKVEQKVFHHLHLFRKPKLLTLTIDRKRFASGREAYEYVRVKIRTFLRLQKFKKGFIVLAFHPDGRDWPHWHILVDLADTGTWVDLKRMWKSWRDDWGCGGLDLNTKKHPRGQQTARQAARYILSYCQHQAGVVAEWVKDMARLPRAYEVYGELRKAIRDQAVKEKMIDLSPSSDPLEKALENSLDDDESTSLKHKRTPRKVSDRLGECGQGASVILRKVWPGGKVTYRYMGKLAMRPQRLAFEALCGEIRTVNVRHCPRRLSNDSWVMDVSIPLEDADPKELFKKLETVAHAILQADSPSAMQSRSVEVCAKDEIPF